jgi:hypothetical protein
MLLLLPGMVILKRFAIDKQQSMQWLPYLTQLSRRPGALKYTGIYKMLPDPLCEYLEKCNKNDRGKILKTIATLTEKSSFEKAVETITEALSYTSNGYR